MLPQELIFNSSKLIKELRLGSTPFAAKYLVLRAKGLKAERVQLCIATVLHSCFINHRSAEDRATPLQAAELHTSLQVLEVAQGDCGCCTALPQS